MTVIYNGTTYDLAGFLTLMKGFPIPFLLLSFAMILYNLLEKERLSKLWLSVLLILIWVQIALSQFTFN